MRTLLALIVMTLAVSAFAQSAPRPRPPGTSPLEEPPPMPAVTETAKGESITEIESKAQVTTHTEGGDVIQEYRVNGKMFMTRVTPKHGRPYVMIDHNGDGTFTRMDSVLPGLRAPQWVLFDF